MIAEAIEISSKTIIWCVIAICIAWVVVTIIRHSR